MAQPMSQGNFIVFKGDKRASGKQNVAISAVKQFLTESKNNQAVFVGFTQQTADRLKQSLDESS
jgi:hypothetical protein